MRKYIFICTLKKILTIILSTRLVFTSLATHAVGKAFLAPPGESVLKITNNDIGFDSIKGKTGFELEPDPQNRAQIIKKNIEFLKSKGWLAPIESLAYDPIFVLADEKFPEFIEQVIVRDKWMDKYVTNLRASLEKDISKLAKRRISLGEPDEKIEEERDISDIIKENIESFAHLLQSVYFFAHGMKNDAEKAFQQYLNTIPKGLSLHMCFGPANHIGNHYYGLGKFIYLHGMHDYTRARYLFNLGVKTFDHKNPIMSTPDNFGLALGAIDLWSGEKRGIDALKSFFYYQNWYARDTLPLIAESDTDVGKRLTEHFNNIKSKTLYASSLVKEKGVAVILGAGVFVVLPIVELLRETLPDGSYKYEKIILIDLAENYTDEAIRDLLAKKIITHDEAKRLEVRIEDGTSILKAFTQRIDEIMVEAIDSHEDKEIPLKELFQFLARIEDPKKMIGLISPDFEKSFKNEEVNFVVFAMALEDFELSMKDYINMWIEGYPQWLDGNRAIDEKWEQYSDYIKAVLAFIILDNVAKILCPEGIFFFCDTIGAEEHRGKEETKKRFIFRYSKVIDSFFNGKFSHKRKEFYFKIMQRFSWHRLPTHIGQESAKGKNIIIGAVTLKKTLKSEHTEQFIETSH